MSAIRMSAEDYERLQSRFKPGVVPVAKKAERKAGQRRNKYGAERTVVDGIEFDSKAEAKRYLQLKAMERAGEISGLEIQVRFELIPAQEIDGRKERPVFYVADFRYTTKAGEVVVEDTKSAPTKTKEYVLKRKLMMQRYGIVIREVLMKD